MTNRVERKKLKMMFWTCTFLQGLWHTIQLGSCFLSPEGDPFHASYALVPNCLFIFTSLNILLYALLSKFSFADQKTTIVTNIAAIQTLSFSSSLWIVSRSSPVNGQGDILSNSYGQQFVGLFIFSAVIYFVIYFGLVTVIYNYFSKHPGEPE